MGGINQISKLINALEINNRPSNWLEASDSLLKKYRYDLLEKLYIFATKNEHKYYINLLIEMAKNSKQVSDSEQCLLQESNYRVFIGRLAEVHPKRLAIYLVNHLDGNRIIELIKSSSNNFDKSKIGNLLIEIIKITIEISKCNKLRDSLMKLGLKYNSFNEMHVPYLAKGIASGYFSIGIEDSISKTIFKILPKYFADDCKDIYSLLNSGDKVSAAKYLVLKRLKSETIELRDLDGNWKIISRESWIKKGGILISGCIWGDKEIYLDGLPEIGWPTLSSSLKLNDRDNGNVIFYSYTTNEAAPHLKQIIDEINPPCYAVIDTSILGSDDEALKNRGFAYIDTILRAISTHSTVVGWSPDVYYGNGLNQMVSNCPEGGIACAPVIRVSQRKFYEYHKIWRANNVRKMTNMELARKAFDGSWKHPYQILYTDNISSQFTSYMKDENTFRLFSWTQNGFVYKPNENFINVMADNCRPRYLNPLSENFAQFLDHDGFHSLYQQGLAYQCPSTETFILIEPSNDKQYNPYNEKMLLPTECRLKVYPNHPYDIVFNRIAN